RRFSEVVAKFRKHFDNPADPAVPTPADLMAAYEKAWHDSEPIPNRLHPSLKARYLLTVEVTRLLREAPGCPPFVMRCILRARATKRGIQRAWRHDLDTIKKPDDAAVRGATPGPLPDGQRNGDSEGVCP